MSAADNEKSLSHSTPSPVKLTCFLSHKCKTLKKYISTPMHLNERTKTGICSNTTPHPGPYWLRRHTETQTFYRSLLTTFMVVESRLDTLLL